MAATLDADECRAALRTRFSESDGFVHLEELQNVGGIAAAEGVRRIDFWAMSTYGSRGYETHGVEIKVRREDLRRELRDPAKAEGVHDFCDYFWLAIGDREIIDGLRLPKTWGVLWPRGDQLVREREPERTESLSRWDRAFVAALVKRCWRPHQENRISRMKREHHRELREARAEGRRRGREKAEEDCAELRERVADFERASGIDLSGRPYSFSRYGMRDDVGRKLGTAVRVLLNGGGKLDRHLSRMRRTASQARKRAEDIEHVADELERFVDDLEEEQLSLVDQEPPDASQPHDA